jgi:hypothetical protein
MPVAFPESESGLDIRLLRHLFTPDEAEIALELSALPEPLERIHKRLKNKGISIEDLEKSLDNMVKKGAILGGKYYEKKEIKNTTVSPCLQSVCTSYREKILPGSLKKIFWIIWTKNFTRCFIIKKHHK